MPKKKQLAIGAEIEFATEALKAAEAQVALSEEAERISVERNIPLVEAKRILIQSSPEAEAQFFDKLKGKYKVALDEGIDKLYEKISNDLIPAKDLIKHLKELREGAMVLDGKPSNITGVAVANANGRTAEEIREDMLKRQQKDMKPAIPAD